MGATGHLLPGRLPVLPSSGGLSHRNLFSSEEGELQSELPPTLGTMSSWLSPRPVRPASWPGTVGQAGGQVKALLVPGRGDCTQVDCQGTCSLLGSGQEDSRVQVPSQGEWGLRFPPAGVAPPLLPGPG